jgi:hypothetical protein
VTLSQGGTATDSIAITETNGFRGNVNLKVTQLPAGITSALNPDATSGKSVLTLSASDSAEVGVHVISVWGSAGGQSTLSPLYLTVQPALAFTLGVPPSVFTIAQGGSNSSTIAISPQPGITADVNLSIASPLPDGITASLAPHSGSADALLALSAASSAAPGQYFINVSGTSGPQTLTITLPFTVEPAKVTATPVFSLAGGVYSSAQVVAISDATPGANVYFTLDGSVPTVNSARYTGPIVILSTQTLQAIGIADGYSRSPVASATYIIENLTNPAPHIETMSPAIAQAGGSAFTLTLLGSGFSQASSVYWESTAVATRFVNSTTLTAQVPASKIATAGAFAITVHTPTSGNEVSNTMQFEVDTAPLKARGLPTFSPPAAQISAGQTAIYQVSLPANVVAVSAACMNLPIGATCTYASSSNQLSIKTATTSPKGTYQVTVAFIETLPSTANQGLALPLFMLPFALRTKNAKPRVKLLALSIALALTLTAVSTIGCGGTSPHQSCPASSSQEQITSSGLVSLTIQ